MVTAFLFLTAAMAATPTSDGSLPNQPVDNLDLARYAGQWHEIARLPQFFERKCVDNITATYTVRPDGRVEVRNACRTSDNQRKASQGLAKPGDGKPGALKVRFAPSWLSWLPLVWADYWVVELDPDYQWAVVGNPNLKYLWILSRQPSMATDQFRRLVANAERRGYPTDRLIMAAPLH